MSGVKDSATGGPNHPIVVAPTESRFWSLPDGVRLAGEPGEAAGVTYPEGFAGSGVAVGLKHSRRPDMGVLAVVPPWREGATSAAVFTRNAFAAAPIQLNRAECELGAYVAVIVNSGNANACTGRPGLSVARAMQHACAETLKVPAARVAVGSTGIIGVQLDEVFMAEGAKKATAAVQPAGGSDFNKAMMTTDRFQKTCAMDVETSDGSVRLGVCAKGAGMISPAMATMLCVVTTDAVVSATDMQSTLQRAVERSFNRVTVDGEMSTNDSVFFMSSGASGVRLAAAGLPQFAVALESLLMRIALMMVADGEGAEKIMRLQVVGAETDRDAAAVARAIADSPLVKTAMHGGDPNWGRIISSAGAAMAGRSLPASELRLGGVKVVEGGAASEVAEGDKERMRAEMRGPEVDIWLNLGLGDSSTELFFADMGHEYVTINAEYHT